jgi:hypothetical protein
LFEFGAPAAVSGAAPVHDIRRKGSPLVALSTRKPIPQFGDRMIVAVST